MYKAAWGWGEEVIESKRRERRRRIEDRVALLGTRYKASAMRVEMVLMERYRVPRTMAEDAVHAVCVRLVRRLREEKMLAFRRLREANYFENYLLRSALNECVDRFRQNERERRKAAAISETIGRYGELHAGASREIEYKELRDAIEELGEPYRRIFHLFVVDEMSLADVARKTGGKAGSIYTQFNRGLEKLKGILNRRAAARRGKVSVGPCGKAALASKRK